MQDFYWIADSDSEWTYPLENQFLGGITLEEATQMDCFWKRLEEKGINLRFFFDSRLYLREVVKSLIIVDACIASEGNSLEYQRLREILINAIERNAGVITFAD